MSTLRMARRRPLMPAMLATVLLGALPLLTACGAGQDAPTRQEYTVADGVQAHAGNIVLRNVRLTADVNDTQKASKTLALQGVVANNTGSPDVLLLVTTGTSAFKATATAATPTSAAATPSGPVIAEPAAPTSLPATVTPGTSLVLGTGGLGLQVTDLPKAVLPGSLVSLRFSFRDAGDVTVAVPVYSLSRPADTTKTVVPPSAEVDPNYNQPEMDNASAVPTP